MHSKIRVKTCSLLLVTALFFCASGGAQQKGATSLGHSRAYDISREVSLQGTVVDYRPLSSTPPLGAHVNLQTSSGIVDVHLGNPQMLAANHLTLAPGDTVRVIGENINGILGTQFFARILQKGSQVIAVRSPQGLPLKPSRAAANSAQQSMPQGRVL
jgi:hypothetical protein